MYKLIYIVFLFSLNAQLQNVTIKLGNRNLMLSCRSWKS